MMLLSISGCAINPGFNQFDLIKRWSRFQEKAEIERQLWTATIGDYQQAAIPVQHDGFMTFYIEDGTEIDFSGWHVLALRNWNYYGKSVDIRPTDSGLTHTLLDDARVSLECSKYLPYSEGFLVEGSIRSATCRSVDSTIWEYRNVVALDSDGAAIWMLHHVSPDMPPLELKLNEYEDSELSENSARLNDRFSR